ncbi:myc target protein 1 homolog [Electrophorus electricus]|uniref:Myc target 1b n=1 Tax=Electrophorus electricus TaxID=8005 RepID=A0AAY5E9H0_ELEEL|nr:myc target protein 1 homolog [Electrophorus electricus]
MAANENNGILEILKTFDIEELTLAFCLSMLVGLLIGILIFIFLTWMSRRRASVRITTHPKKQARSSRTGNTRTQLGLYRSNGFNLSSDGTDRTALNLQRQTSVDPNELLGQSPSFQASTFRPPKKKASSEITDENQGALLHNSTSTSPAATDPYNTSQSESFWLGKGTLRGFLPTQTPPPAYDSVIHVFQTHT